MLTKVLVVDDSQAEIRLLQSVLQQGGFHSVAISDPTKIEETIEEERPNVILLDVVMPQRNGFQACRDLKNQALYSKIPVILVTSNRHRVTATGASSRARMVTSRSRSRRTN